MSYTFALTGNPNCGKSTVFNELTGSRQYVGNWPGVTVEKKEGFIKNSILNSDEKITLVDLPGTYSLSPSSPEQKIARDFVKNGQADAVINIVDATNLERNLFLTTQLLELNIPVVVGLNMMDIIEKKGDKILLNVLSEYLGIPFIPISASKNDNLDKLVMAAIDAARMGNKPTNCQFCKSPCKNSSQRYNLASEAAGAAYVKGKDSKPEYTAKLDKVLLNKYLAIPIFLLVMYTVFTITFGSWVTFAQDWIAEFFNVYLSKAFVFLLNSISSPAWVISLVSDGIIVGIGSIISFLPQITILFSLLAILEDSGYMVRVAFILDKLMRPFGLGGKSFIPMVIGFGCSVPAIMSARTLDSHRERKLTVLIAPFMSCSARLPIYILFTGIFFKEHQQIVVFSMYVLGAVIAMISGFVLSQTVVKGERTEFLLEIPPYRMPTLKNIGLHVWERVWDFVERAGTIIFVASVIVWFCQKFTFTMQVANVENSIISTVGKLAAPVFVPLGFGNWHAVAALITGLAAKEMVVATLSIIEGNLSNIFTKASAVSYMVFTLLYIPCFATIAAIKNELKSSSWAVFAALYQLVTAWIVSFVVYIILRMVGL